MIVMHSCCPNKRDINAPEFEHTDTLDTSRHIMKGWTCKGCKTVIYIAEAK